MRRGQVFETIGVDRPPVPRLQLVRHALGCVASLAIAVPPPQPVELGAVGAQQFGQVGVEIVGLDEPGFELRDRGSERIGEAGEPRGAPCDSSQQ